MATLPILVSFASAGAPGLAGALGTLTGALSGPAGVALAAGAAAAAIANMTAMAAAEEKNIAGLRASLAAAGVSYDKNAEDIEGLINKREELAFADDAQRDSLSRLVQMTGSLAEAQNLQAIAMDLARGKNMDLVAASELVGKVAAGNTGILGRYGIVLEEGATATEALDAISARFAGQSEAYAKTAAAGWERFNNELGNVQEDIGTALLPVMLELGTAVGDLFQEMQDSGALQDLGDALTMFGKILITDVDIISTVVKSLVGLMDTSAAANDTLAKALTGDFAGAMESAGRAHDSMTGVIEANTGLVERSIARFAETTVESSDQAGDAVTGLADAGEEGFGRFGDAAEDAATSVFKAMGISVAAMATAADIGQYLAGTIEGEADMVERAAQRQIEWEAVMTEAFEEGQRLAAAYGETLQTDVIDRHLNLTTVVQEGADVQAELIGERIIAEQAAAEEIDRLNLETAALQAREDAKAADAAEREAARSHEAWMRAEQAKAANAGVAAAEQIRAANAAGAANVAAANAARAAWAGQAAAHAATGSWQTAANMQWKGEFDWGPGGTLSTNKPRGWADGTNSTVTPAGTTVHAQNLIINARGSAAEELNALSALVR